MYTGAFTVGVIGHRYLGDESSELFVRTCCHRLLSGLRYRHGRVKAISAMSDGADSVFAQSAIALGIELESVIPFSDFESDFADERSRERFKALRANADRETRVNFLGRSPSAYRKSMEWLVFKSHLVVAMWNGDKTITAGGTWESILLCQAFDKPLIRIDSKSRTMSALSGDNSYSSSVDRSGVSRATKSEYS